MCSCSSESWYKPDSFPRHRDAFGWKTANLKQIYVCAESRIASIVARHIADQQRAQAPLDVEHHMAWLGHLRAAMCPTTSVCTPFAQEALVSTPLARTAGGAITKSGGWKTETVATHCIWPTKCTQPPSVEQTAGPQLRYRERVATAVRIPNAPPPRARRTTPKSYQYIQSSLGGTTERPGRWQMTTR